MAGTSPHRLSQYRAHGSDDISTRLHVCTFCYNLARDIQSVLAISHMETLNFLAFLLIDYLNFPMMNYFVMYHSH